MRARLEDRVLRVLGGMGPLATGDFMREIILATPAETDADHLPVFVSSCPQIPGRVAPIREGLITEGGSFRDGLQYQFGRGDFGTV